MYLYTLRTYYLYIQTAYNRIRKQSVYTGCSGHIKREELIKTHRSSVHTNEILITVAALPLFASFNLSSYLIRINFV
jgi:hypothetical protein